MTKHFIKAGLAVAALALPSAALASHGLEGRWKKGNLEIRIAPCGPALCGTVVKASAKQKARAERGSGTDLIGAKLITGIRPSGPGTYSARVFVADRNMHARGTIRQVSPDRLSVKGCAYLVICKSANWVRVGR